MQEIWMILRTTAGNPSLLVPALVDIFLVSMPFYLVFSLLRRGRSTVALWGIMSLLAANFLLYLAARIWDLPATALIFERFWLIIVLIFLIIFQSELRRGLTDLSRARIFRMFLPREKHLIDEVVEAVGHLASKRTGALIVFERANSLKPYMATGTMLDAIISSEMIRAVFIPQSPLHDGAMIVRGGRIVAVACILPLTEDARLSKDLGTRHRAAIGLTEETDAVVVVVSEETGAISIARDGKIERFLELTDLSKMLAEELDLSDGEEEAARG